MTRILLAGCLLTGSFACATVSFYEVPADRTGFATIQENDPLRLEFFDRQYIRISSIDRKHIRRGINGQPIPEIKNLSAEYAILLQPGEHQVLAHACIHKVKALINAGWQCAETVLHFIAEPDTNYFLKGDIHRKEDYADFWIEKLATQQKVTEPVRVSGFPEAH
jgi:hypothetical protein